MSDIINKLQPHPVSDLASLEPYFDDMVRAIGGTLIALKNSQEDSADLFNDTVDKIFACSRAYHEVMTLQDAYKKELV